MRVITGSARGRKLKEPRDRRVRPTTDMVKEAMFNIIQFEVPEARVLDLFAGTGQLGIEALSRGAAEAVFVDSDPDSLRLTRENLALTRLEARAKVLRSDALGYLRRGEKFDLVFLDPPYATELLENAIEAAIGFDILREDGIMLCESRPEKALPDPAREDYQKKEYQYGKIKLTVYRREG